MFSRVVRCFAFSLLCCSAAVVRAQSSAEVAMRFPATWASGPGAPTVRTDAAPMISLNSGGQLNPNTRVSLDVRLSNASVKLTEDAQKWGGGTLTLVDVIGTLGWRLLLPDHGYVSFEGGLGVTVLGGARNVAPFHEASRAIPVAEATIAYDLPFTFSRATTALLVRSSFLRIGGKNADDAVQAPGYVRRVSVGVRVSR